VITPRGEDAQSQDGQPTGHVVPVTQEKCVGPGPSISQQIDPAPHAGEQTGAAQCPPRHIDVEPAHDSPQMPQLLGSLFVSRHAPSQHVSPSVHAGPPPHDPASTPVSIGAVSSVESPIDPVSLGPESIGVPVSPWTSEPIESPAVSEPPSTIATPDDELLHAKSKQEQNQSDAVRMRTSVAPCRSRALVRNAHLR